MGWTHGQNETERLPKKIWDKEAMRLQTPRRTASEMGALCGERFKKGRGRRKVERKGQ